MFAGGDGQGGWAGGRNPLAMPSAVTRGPGPQEIPFGTTRSILQVGGMPGQGTIWNLSISGASPPAAGVLVDALVDVVAIVSWQMGNTRQRIEVDLPAAGLSFPLAFESIEVSIAVPVQPGPGSVFYQAAVSACYGGSTSAVPRRTVRVRTPGVVNIPPKASRLQGAIQAAVTPPPAAVQVLIAITDSAGITALSAILPNDGTIQRAIDLPGGSAIVNVSALVGNDLDLSLTFEINP